MRFHLFGSASLLAFSLITTQAQAQDQADAPGEVEEVVVTAMRASTSLQKTPAAVTVVTGEVLERQQIHDVRGVQNLTPAARFSAANTSTRIFIRGVGSGLDFYWIPETSAVNLNGSYVPRFGISGGFYDIESVQVLPGPQGVLYGRSAGGGAVVINTRKPVIGDTSASATVQYGNYDSLYVEGVANVAMGDDIAVRLAAVRSRNDGYAPYGLQSDDSYGIRASALYEPNNELSVLLWGAHYEQNGKPTVGTYLPYTPGENAWFVAPFDPVTGTNISTGARLAFNTEIAGYTVNYDLNDVAIKYTGSILRQTEKAQRKLVGNNQILNNAQTQYVQSLQLSGSVGALDLIGGGDWFYAKSRFNSQLGPNRLGSIFPSIKQRSISGFLQGTYNVNDSLRLVAGARYTEDSLKLAGTNIRCFGPCVFPPVTFDKTWHQLDLKGGVEADIADDVMVYANVQTGYAPGTLNTVVADNTTPPAGVNREVKPQTLLAYTAGLKSTLADGKLTLNLEAYHYKYKKLIIQSFVPALNQQTLFNAPEATVYGAQLTSAFRPTDNDTLSINVAYTHGRYGSFVATPGTPNLDGLQMVYTPDWTGTLSYEHRFDLADGASIDARVSTYLSDSFWGSFTHSRDTQQEAYMKSDASLTYNSADGRWTFGAWVKNIENEPVATAPGASGYAAPYAGVAFIEAPRTYGVTLGVKM